MFDLMHLDGADLAKTDLLERKLKLEKLLAGACNRYVRYTDHILGDGPAFYEQARHAQLEWIVSKRITSRYEGKRSKSWVEVKCTAHGDFVVVGYTEPTNSRVGFDSLLLAAHDEEGALRYVGRVGTGFTNIQLAQIYEQLSATRQKVTPVVGKGPSTSAVKRWVRPVMVVEVEYTEMTQGGKLRHPTFRGLREDKDPSEARLALRASIGL